MPHDKRGEELKVDDVVMVPCRVLAIHLTRDFCNVDLETTVGMPPTLQTVRLTLNSRQTIKPTATHRFAEYGSEPDAKKPISPFALRDAIKILTRLVGPCEGGTSDHEWRKCRRCLTLHEIQNHQEPSIRLLRVVLAQFGEGGPLMSEPDAPGRDPCTHDLKVWPEYFDALVSGEKPFEVRIDDRGGFSVGDTLRLREWANIDKDGHETGRVIERQVTYVLNGPKFGVQEGYSVLGLRAASAEAHQQEIELLRKKAHDWNAEADKYLAQRDELTIQIERLTEERDAALKARDEAQAALAAVVERHT